MTFATQLFQSENLVLQGYDPEKDAAVEAGFSYDVNYARVIDFEAVPHPYSVFEVKKKREEQLKTGVEKNNFFLFGVHQKSDGKFLGIITFPSVFWFNRYAFFKVSLGDPETQRLYYADALQMALRYGLDELGLYSVFTSSGEYEPGIMEALLNAGFNASVSQREAVYREGRLWDNVYMELLQTEWKNRNLEAQK